MFKYQYINIIIVQRNLICGDVDADILDNIVIKRPRPTYQQGMRFQQAEKSLKLFFKLPDPSFV